MRAYRVQRKGDSREDVVCGRVGRREEGGGREAAKVSAERDNICKMFRDTRRPKQNACLVV